MLKSLSTLVNLGISHAKVNPGMVLTAARDVYITFFDRGSGQGEYLFAREGDQIEILSPEPHRGTGFFTVQNHDNFDDIGSITTENLEDAFKEYT